MRPKVKPVKDKIFYRQWAEEHDHCQACGIDAQRAVFERWPGLSTHHIVKFRRSDERCNLLRLCQRCHDLAEGRQIRVGGLLLPHLTLAVCLGLKLCREPQDMSLERLEELYGRRLPDPGEIPEVIEREYRLHRPHDVFRYTTLAEELAS